MSRQTRISAWLQAVALKMNTLKSLIGDFAGLSTTDTSSLVAAINEVKATADSAAGGGVAINDAATNTTQTWSSNKIKTEITADIATALEGEDLSDLAAQVAANAAADAGLVSASAVQSFNASQQAQARTNINAVDADDVGNTDYDFAAEFNALVSF